MDERNNKDALKDQPFGLPDRTLDDIENALKLFPEIEKVQIFGSRAMGNFKHSSDIDMCLWGDIDLRLLSRITGTLDDLPTPYKFDVVVYDDIIHPPFREHIDEHGVDFFDALPARQRPGGGRQTEVD